MLRHRTERCVGSPWSGDARLIAQFVGWLKRPTALSAVRVIWDAPLWNPLLFLLLEFFSCFSD